LAVARPTRSPASTRRSVHRPPLEGRDDHRGGPLLPLRDCKLHTLAERRPPVYVSAFGPQAAEVAGRWGDGLWTLPDPESTPEVIEAYREARRRPARRRRRDRLPGPVSWAESDDEALEAARIWKGAQPPEHFTDDWHKPAEMYEHGEQEVSDDEFKENAIISADPEHHVERLRELEDLGATIVVLQNNSGAAPMKAIEVYGSEVLPALTRARSTRVTLSSLRSIVARVAAAAAVDPVAPAVARGDPVVAGAGRDRVLPASGPDAVLAGPGVRSRRRRRGPDDVVAAERADHVRTGRALEHVGAARAGDRAQRAVGRVAARRRRAARATAAATAAGAAGGRRRQPDRPRAVGVAGRVVAVDGLVGHQRPERRPGARERELVAADIVQRLGHVLARRREELEVGPAVVVLADLGCIRDQQLERHGAGGGVAGDEHVERVGADRRRAVEVRVRGRRAVGGVFVDAGDVQRAAV
jgi:hypothetical protein